MPLISLDIKLKLGYYLPAKEQIEFLEDFVFNLMVNRDDDEAPTLMMSTSGYSLKELEPERTDKLESGYSRGSYLVKGRYIVSGEYEPKIIICGSPNWPILYKRNSSKFFQDIVKTISHETLHNVIAGRLCSREEFGGIYSKAAYALDNPMLNGEEASDVDVCGLNLKAMIIWSSTNHYSLKR